MVAVAVIFERWARQAIALGWDELDLIGAHPRYPVQRIDHRLPVDNRYTITVTRRPSLYDLKQT